MRGGVAVTAAVVVALAAGTAHGADPVDGVSVTTGRTQVTTVLGERFSLTTKVANATGVGTEPLVATLNVTSLADGVYVDPEDWSGERTRYLGRLAPGGTINLRWHLQAVTSGDVAVYVTVLRQSGASSRPSTSPAVRIVVADRSTLDAGGALYLAVGLPAVVGLLALAARATRRRRS